MACPRCQLRLTKRPKVHIFHRRPFHTSPRHQRLGAATYPQQWQTGSYHFNKAHTKTLPVAAQHTDYLLTTWATQQKRRGAPDSAMYKQIQRNSITAQRRRADNILISKSSAKDFGDRVEVTAFVFDGIEAAEKEEERKRKARMGVKPDGEKAGQGRRRRGPVRRGTGGTGGAPGARRAGTGRVAPGTPGVRTGRAPVGRGGGLGFRSLPGIGSGPPRR